MVSKLINSFVDTVANQIKEYGIPLESQYNSDLDMISEYTKSLKLRTVFLNNSDLTLLDGEQIDNLNSNSYNLLMYTYSPLRRDNNKLNNMDLELVFNSGEIPPLSKMEYVGVDENWRFLYQKIRSLNEENKNGLSRNVIFGGLDLTFKILSTDTNTINDIQLIYLQRLQRVKNIKMDLDLGEGIGVHTFGYMIDFNEIDSIGHIDRSSYGNLQHITFSGTISGPIFSSFVKKVPYLEKMDIVVDLK